MIFWFQCEMTFSLRFSIRKSWIHIIVYPITSKNYLNILTSLLQNCHKCRRNNVKIFENIVSLGWKFLLNPFTTWDIAWWLFVMRGLSHPFRATLTLVASAFPKNVYAKIIALKTCNWPNKLLLRLFHLIHRKWA